MTFYYYVSYPVSYPHSDVRGRVLSNLYDGMVTNSINSPGSFTDLKGGYHFMCEMVGRPVTWAVYPFATAIGAAW